MGVLDIIAYRKGRNEFMPIPEITGGSNSGRVESELNKLKGQKGPAQGPVDHFKIKPRERAAKEEPKITKVFQERGEEASNLIILDVKRGIEVEERKGPTKVFQVFGKGSEVTNKASNQGNREEKFSLRAGK